MPWALRKCTRLTQGTKRVIQLPVLHQRHRFHRGPIAARTAAPGITVQIQTHGGNSRTDRREVEFHHYLIELLQQEEDASDRHCKRTVAAVAAAAAVVAVGKWKTTCKVLLSVLSVFPCSRFSLSPPAFFPVSRISCAALVAARHTLRRSRAVRRCGPLLTRTHQALCHHVMCLFDTWLSSCNEFESSPCSSTSPSCPSWAFASLSCPPWA